MDQFWRGSDAVRMYLGYLVTPVYWMSAVPGRLQEWLADTTLTRTQLLEENRRLQREALVLEQKIQQMIALKTENQRLRDLLKASEQFVGEALVVELLSVDPDPFTHKILINKGQNQGVKVGQPVLDAFGLMGQVVEVLPHSSRVLLVADSDHAIPVQVTRNGVRAIAVGSGTLDYLDLVYVPDTADLRVGDHLESSGLGDRFPRGYPVAEVVSVEHDPGEPFALVRARPLAHLDRSRYLLIISGDKKGNLSSIEEGQVSVEDVNSGEVGEGEASSDD